MRDLIEQYTQDKENLGTFYHVAFSPMRHARLRAFYTEWQARLESADFDALDQDGKVDYILLRRELKNELRTLEFQMERRDAVLHLLPFAAAIAELEERRMRIEPLDPKETAANLNEILKQAEQLHRRVETGHDPNCNKADEEIEPLKPGEVLAFRASKMLKELREVLETWFKHYDGFDPLFTWWCRKPGENLKKKLDEYEKLLREKVAGAAEEDESPMVGDPVGAERLAEDLAHEMVPYTPEELIEIAEREFSWCDNEYANAAQEMGKKDWREALDHVKNQYVPPGEQGALVAAQAREAIRFVEERDLVMVDDLCKETWRVDMLDEKAQRRLPFAAYGGQKQVVSYPLDTMDTETKLMSLRGNNRHFNRNVTPHELIPGHHLQSYISKRHRAYRGVFRTPFYIEGWTMHWEFLFWELGWPQSPEDRIGMLFWRSHRCARIIVSLKFHLEEMEPQEMVDYLVERVGHERHTAESEVRRFIGDDYPPLYQCAYLIGGLQVHALYRELVGDGIMAPKEFHDRFLRLNAVPIALARASLKDLPLSPDYEGGWRLD
ncbi:MAG: DUF885 family protein [Armatimonadetes bacterium]|nr:DUF885 family protein [Armatimonadota bacterium]